MCDYVSMRSIQLKNAILTPKVLDLYRSGDLNLSSIQGTVDPLVEVYRDTYNYIQFPNLSEQAQKLVMPDNPVKSNLQPRIHSAQVTPPVRSVDGQFNGPLTYGPMESKDLSNPKFTYDYTKPLIYKAPKSYTIV